MRRVERLYVAAASRKAARREASVGTALRAMSMQHIQIQRCGMRANGADSCQIAKPPLAADRDTRNAESEFFCDRRELCRRQLIFSRTCCENADVMAVRRLFLCKIENVAEETADGRTKTMEYTHTWTCPER